MTDTTDLIQRLKAFRGLWLGDGIHPSVERQKVIDALEQQAAQIAMLEQRATCGCGDQFTAHDPGTCGNCCAAADRSNEIEALRADAERLRGACQNARDIAAEKKRRILAGEPEPVRVDEDDDEQED